MLQISVRLDSALLERGELLAEASAMEAAGVDTVWLPEESGGLDGTVLLAGLAGSLRRARLGLALGAQQPGWSRRAGTLQMLSRGRLVLSAPADRAPADPPASLLLLGATPLAGAAGLIHPASTGVGDLSAAVAAAPAHEHWLEADGSRGRAAWRTLRGEAVAAGATGILVSHHPVLLDLLRNPDGEDDRGDLQMATG